MSLELSEFGVFYWLSEVYWVGVSSFRGSFLFLFAVLKMIRFTHNKPLESVDGICW